MLVCDGLDEVSYEECELLEIIAGRMYPNVRCIVTCRPHASLGMSLTADAEIRLKGFSKRQARHYVDIYFRQKYPSNRKLAEQESSKLWNDIESSPDLLEMSINPSMLQLLCKMFSETGKIAKDRATVFKDYTYFLLQQMHVKLHKKSVGHSELRNMYRGTILKAGHLALQGLKQSHLQLIFTKESVIKLAGKEMFDIGFVTEIPGHGFEKPKAQFQHKTHQEYLAAYFIVKNSDDVGIKYLMEFCSTSKGLMGSQIILTFITSMSKKMGKVIQKKIRELVSSWASEDDISPKDRTSFLLTMLEENKSLSFPLPEEIDINVREYEKSSGWFQKILQKFGKKGALETFFSFESRGVQKITIVLGKEYRLELLKNFKSSHLQVVSVNFQSIFFEKDSVHLISLIQNNEKLKLLSIEKMLTLDCRNSEFISCLVKCKHLKIIKISKCEMFMDGKLADAFKHFLSHVELDISGNIFTNQSGCEALIQNAAHLTSLRMQDCGIIIDTDIAEAISQLPEQANLDMSGNTVTKMDSILLSHVIPVVSNKTIDLSGIGVVIDAKVAKAVCSLDEHVNVDISDNVIAQMDYQLLCQLLYRIYRETKVDVRRNRTFFKTNLLQLIHMKATDTDFDITKNNPIKQDIILSLIITSDEWKPLFLQDNNETVIKEAKTQSQHLQGHIQLEIHATHLPQMSEPILPTITYCISDKAKVDLSCIQFLHNENIDQSLFGLPKSVELDMSGHHIASKDTCIKLIKDAGTLEALKMQDCGIIIDTEVAEAISKLPDQANLDLSGNTIAKMDSSLLCHVIPVIRHKNIDLSGLGLIIDGEISKAICILNEDVNVDISENIIAQMDYQLLCQLLYRLYRKTIVEIYTNRRVIKYNLLQAINMKSTDTYFDISSNDTVIQDIILSMILTADKWKTRFQQDKNEFMTNEAKTVLSQQLQGHVQLEIHDIYLPQMQNPILPIVTACMTDQGKADLSQINFQVDENTENALLHLPKNVQLDLSNHRIANNSTSLKIIKKAGTLAVLILQNCGIEINTDIAETVLRLPDHTELDLSGNQVTDKSACITLIRKAATMKTLSICNCGIDIDTEIAEAVSKLHDHTKLDISGNQVTDTSACITLIHKAASMQSLNIHNCMSNCGIQIDTEIAEAVSKLPDHTQLDLSGNQVTDKSACITLIHKAATMKSLNIHDCMSNCYIQIDTEIAEAVSKLPDHTQLDLSGNQVTNKSACITLLNKAASMKYLNIHDCMSNCGIEIDTDIAEAVSRLPDDTQLDLSGNNITDKSACITLIHKAASMKSLNIHDCMSNCCIEIDTEIADAVSRLPDDTQLDLSGNQVTDKSICISLIDKAASMKSLSICNCGIQIDTEIAEAVFRLPDQTQLDLSCNKISNMKPELLTMVLTYMTKQDIIDINRWRITVDVTIVRAISNLSKLIGINIIFPDGKLTTQAAAEFPYTISFMPHLLGLNLVGCDIKKDAAIALTDSLSKHCPQLEILSLSNNNLSTGMQEAAKHIQKMKNLEKLFLSNCGISNDVMVTLTDNISKHCPLLEVLSLSNNNLSSGVWNVLEHIKHMTNLRRLRLAGNACMEDDKQKYKIETTLHRSNPNLDVL